MTRFINLPSFTAANRLVRSATKLAVFTLPVLLLTHEAFAQANTLGNRLTAASTDLTAGGGYVLQILGYLLGGCAMLAGIYTIWQHTKNPNGQSRLGYGFVSVLAGGAFLTASLMASFASNTVAGAGPSNTGTAAQMMFN